MPQFLDDDSQQESLDSSPTVLAPTLPDQVPTTITGWENDPRVQKEAEIYLYELSQTDNTFDPGTWFDDNMDIKEVLRDEDYRISTIINRAGNIDDLSERGKEAFRFLRDTWSKAEVSNERETWDAVRDIGTDLIADPITLLGLLFTGGSGNAVAQTAGKEGLKQALRNAAVSNTTKAQTVRGTIAAGSAGGIYEDQLQRVELDTNISDNYDFSRTATMAGVSSVAGGALTALSAGTSKYLRKKAQERLNQEEIFRKANAEKPLENDPDIDKAVDDNLEVLTPSDSTEVSVDVKPGRASIVIDAEDVEVFSENVTNTVGGGGQRTQQEVVDVVNQIQRDNPTLPLSQLKNRLGFEINRIVNKFGSRIAFKPVSVVESFSKYSETANNLMKKFRYDAGRKIWGDREYDQQDFHEVFKETAGRYYVRSKVALEPVALNMKGELGDLANDKLVKVLRGAEADSEATEVISKELKSILDEIGDELLEAGYISEKASNYFPRMWDRTAINKNKDLFAEKLEKSGEVNSKEEGLALVEDMLDKQNQLDQGSSVGNSFFYKRVFKNIKDNDFEEFLNSDVNEVMNNYIFQASKQVAKKKVFGVKNFSEYKEVYIDSIRQEMRRAGKTLTAGDEGDLEKVWRLTTGEGVKRFENSINQGVVDFYGVANRLAYLPLSTLSSVTEVFINVAKAGGLKSLRGFVSATDKAQDTIQKQLKEKLGKQGLSEDEIWKEMNKFGLALDMSVSDTIDRLSGTELNSKLARKVNNTFFRANLLDQWTKFVQMSSYITGKNLIRDNLEEISKHAGLPDSKRITRMKDELKELNVNIEDGLDWISKGANSEDNFNEIIQRGASRYANEVILNPSAESGLKPMLMANPQTSILFQFMGYPAAFTNTVLKNAAKNLIRDPSGNLPKTLAASLIMTETARWSNYARSGGESERFKDREDIYSDAVIRWGGNGLIADMMQRGRKAAQVYQDPLAYGAGMLGPVGQDMYTLIRRGDLVSFFGKKVPGYGAGKTVERVFDVEFMDAWDKKLKEVNKSFEETVVPEREPRPFRFAKGGEVEIPGAAKEPDQRIDKMTGLPYDQQAGTAFVDQEDPLRRMGFNTGSQATTDPLQSLGFGQTYYPTAQDEIAGAAREEANQARRAVGVGASRSGSLTGMPQSTLVRDLNSMAMQTVDEAVNKANTIVDALPEETKERVFQEGQRQIDLGQQRAAEDEAVRTGKLKKVAGKVGQVAKQAIASNPYVSGVQDIRAQETLKGKAKVGANVALDQVPYVSDVKNIYSNIKQAGTRKEKAKEGVKSILGAVPQVKMAKRVFKVGKGVGSWAKNKIKNRRERRN